MPVEPSSARKQKILSVFFQKRAIELQTAVSRCPHQLCTCSGLGLPFRFPAFSPAGGNTAISLFSVGIIGGYLLHL